MDERENKINSKYKDEPENKIYACIDLKSFFASVEAVRRGLDPMTANLVVADPDRGRGAICLAVTPAMKKLGVKNRCRIFEIPESINYITAKPRMLRYMQCSSEIYKTYLRFISPDDIHVYSIDECFFNFTPYLSLYKKTPTELSQMLMDEVKKSTGISSSAGIGTNLFLAKVALDITAKHSQNSIGYLDRAEFERRIWRHRPISDIWNIGPGIAKRLEKYRIFDLYGVAHFDEKLLYREFGKNAEYLIDHSHAYEPCTIRDIHEYIPSSTSISNSQILFENYKYEDALLVLREMTNNLSMEMAEKSYSTDSISLSVGYADSSLKTTGGTRKLGYRTLSYKKLSAEFEKLFRETTRKGELIRKLAVGANNLDSGEVLQMSMFPKDKDEESEQKIMDAILLIKHKYGKNSIIRGMSLQENATATERNKLIGGHNGE